MPKVVADRTGDVLRVVCPHSGFRNEFPDLRMVHVFLCEQCGEAVAVDVLQESDPDLQESEEVIHLQLSALANAGPISILGYTALIEPAGEVVKK